ncbi:MAG: hypothetical protein K1000chlam4_00591 [Chlamydiae bacterium]|nr:hypothetical protein [Chlamydiota bacterium]
MSRTNKSKKRALCLDDMPIVSAKRGIKSKKFDPAKKLRNLNFVAKVFFLALLENDVEAALDTLNGYLMAIGKTDLAKQGEISASTVYHALSQGANPTLRTVAKLLHASSDF